MLGNIANICKSVPIVLLLCVSFAQPTLAEEKIMMRTLTVSGRGIESIPTTLSQVNLSVEVQGKTPQEVQQEAARRSFAVVNFLKSRQVEKLQTTGISLSPIYNYTNNVQRITGYTATNSLSFRVNTEKAGNILDEAVKAGATRIDGISFVASDLAIAAAQLQALQEATQDAQKQANAVLSSLSLKSKEVVSIQINSASAPPPPVMYRSEAMGQARGAKDTPVVGGEQQVDATVTLQISY